MAVVIKNTFLHVVAHETQGFTEPSGRSKRSTSVPPEWKPFPVESETFLTLTTTGSCTPRSTATFFSAFDGSESLSINGDAVLQQASVAFEQGPCIADYASSESTSQVRLVDAASGTDPVLDLGALSESAGRLLEFNCPTPTSVGSPRDFGWSQSSPQASVSEGLEMDHVFGCPTNYDSLLGNLPSDVADLCMVADRNDVVCMECTPGFPGMLESCFNSALGLPVAGVSGEDYGFVADDSEVIKQVCALDVTDMRTSLRSDAVVFQPALRSDARVAAVVDAIYIALASSGKAGNIHVDKNPQQGPHTTISAEVQPEDESASDGYNLIQLAKQSAEAISERLSTIKLLSARVQKEHDFYGLRMSIAGLPENAKSDLCWDVCQRGYCPRRDSCRWHHPQDDDIFRVKVTIRYSKGWSRDSIPHQLTSCGSSGKHKLSLGELI